MEITESYLIQKIAECRKASAQLRRDADATDGAGQAYEQLLNELHKQEKANTEVKS